jgi:hypothetical protein
MVCVLRDNAYACRLHVILRLIFGQRRWLLEGQESKRYFPANGTPRTRDVNRQQLIDSNEAGWAIRMPRLVLTLAQD